MILTGNAIREEYMKGKITLNPFLEGNINPNSYNFRLDRVLKTYSNSILDPKLPQKMDTIILGDDGYVLEPYKLYLANTIEEIGSDYYAPTYNARSSVARLVIFINLSATLLDIGFKGQITMQLYSANHVKIYYGMDIGQVMFWKPKGKISLYSGKYQNSKGPQVTQIYKDFKFM